VSSHGYFMIGDHFLLQSITPSNRPLTWVDAMMSWKEIQHLLTLVLSISTPIIQSGLRIILVVVAGFFGIRAIVYLLNQKERLLIGIREPTETIPSSTQKRMKTITNIITAIAKFGIWSVVFVVVLDQMGINITPLITSAGILGIAVGFGAQTLIQDIISGFFMLLENQVRVGDVVLLNGTEGHVEGITFRVITLRDVSGTVHIFRNGSINTVSNMTKDWSAYVIDLCVAYKEDTDRVVDVMQQVAEEIRQEPLYQRKMIAPIEIFGVDSFGALGVMMKARLKTLPNEQWSVGREYRRRLKKAFDLHGIEIPCPRRSFPLE